MRSILPLRHLDCRLKNWLLIVRKRISRAQPKGWDEDPCEARVVFFVIVKPANALMARMKKAEAAAPPPPTPEDVQLLTEIRDLLKK